MVRKAIAVFFLLTGIALGQEKVPVGPFTIVGPQGRPIPGATATVTTESGGATTVWADKDGTTVFDGLVGANNILQFFADPGVYKVSAGGLGDTKVFYTFVVGRSANTISIDRTADMLLLTTASPPALTCPTGSFCTLAFDDTTDETAMFDFVLPTFTISFNSLTLSHNGVGTGNVVWGVDWCVTPTTSVPCTPDGTHKQTYTVLPLAGRTDLLISSSQLSTDNWTSSNHVVMWISREASDAADTMVGDVTLHNVRLEFVR